MAGTLTPKCVLGTVRGPGKEGGAAVKTFNRRPDQTWGDPQGKRHLS